jgi:hypothetical protein
MERDALLGTSRREETLYRDLLAAYESIGAALGDEIVAVDPARVAAGYARAETVTGELRALATALAPHRLTGASLPAEVQALWRSSAHLAAVAADANAALTARARARQAAVTARLARLAGARQGLAAYRPLRPGRAGLDQRI